ncbi:eukaryotic mitochondrial regulator protein-domain-containing protein [Pestalotiopsis sp. NC0098]|nr:eukaryotic mitochondrial regulator protein-domain-containing protein [Pestalotiopsis sp. NC0098]
MPPRCSCSAISSSPSTLWQASINAARAPAQQQITAAFSTTASREYNSKERRKFWAWQTQAGTRYRRPRNDGRTNYLSATKAPFPMNPQFVSKPILTDGARELIWSKVIEKGETIKAVSAELGVDINRVAAVVRLKEVEKDMIAKGKELAIPYQNAIMGMVPTKFYRKDEQNRPLEAINELHVHTHTMKQLYWPTSESRQFTREDAAKAFHRNMLSADARVPHPELVQMERDLLENKSPAEAKAQFLQSTVESERKAAEQRAKKAQEEERALQRINTKRFEFRFKEINAEDVGSDGRKITAVGARYGRPSYDRVKGAVKIPTSVP